MLYRVNHNGTEDWTDPPAGTRRDPDTDAVLFDGMEAARAFADEVARDVVAALVEAGQTPDEARETLVNGPRGVPVQIISDLTREVVGWVVPRTVPAPGEPLTPAEVKMLDDLRVTVRGARERAARVHDTIRSRTEWGTGVTAAALDDLTKLHGRLDQLLAETQR